MCAGSRLLKQSGTQVVVPEVALTPAALTPAEADAPAALLIVEPVAAAPGPIGAATSLAADAPLPIVRLYLTPLMPIYHLENSQSYTPLNVGKTPAIRICAGA